MLEWSSVFVVCTKGPRFKFRRQHQEKKRNKSPFSNRLSSSTFTRSYLKSESYMVYPATSEKNWSSPQGDTVVSTSSFLVFFYAFLSIGVYYQCSSPFFLLPLWRHGLSKSVHMSLSMNRSKSVHMSLSITFLQICQRRC